MNKFNLDSAKFVSIIIGICFIFVMVVWHAFNYLPNKSSEQVLFEQPTASGITENVQEEVRQNAEEEQEQGEASDYQEQDEIVKTETSKAEQELEPLEPIVSDEQNVEKGFSSIEKSLEMAKNYKESQSYVNAISEYQKVIGLTEESKVKAQCYEEISYIYASQKRYGSALSAAQKAYNTSPSTSREVLLARLYYKTGDIDKATNRLNNVLRRDFLPNDK